MIGIFKNKNKTTEQAEARVVLSSVDPCRRIEYDREKLTPLTRTEVLAVPPVRCTHADR